VGNQGSCRVIVCTCQGEILLYSPPPRLLFSNINKPASCRHLCMQLLHNFAAAHFAWLPAGPVCESGVSSTKERNNSGAGASGTIWISFICQDFCHRAARSIRVRREHQNREDIFLFRILIFVSLFALASNDD
jgi:hypothetical protein